MKIPETLKDWTEVVGENMGYLSNPEISVLAEYSFGVAVTKDAGQNTVATFLAELQQAKFNTVRQRLRELTYDAETKRGSHRREIDVSESFQWILRWVLSDWQDDKVVLALDPTYLGDRFIILSISVVYRGSAIPVAWHVQPTYQQGEWHDIWLRLLDAIAAPLDEQVAHNRSVWLLTDRGLYSKRLFEAIVEHGWHPLMRIRTQGFYQPVTGDDWLALDDLPTVGMDSWSETVVCFKNDPLPCTLMAQWDAIYDEPCLVVTDVPPHQADMGLYAHRVWIELGFKDLKRGGIRWEQTKMRHPDRVERLWLVLAVALLYLLRLGNDVERESESTSALDRPNHPGGLGLLKLGWVTLLARLIWRAERAFLPSFASLYPYANLKVLPS